VSSIKPENGIIAFLKIVDKPLPKKSLEELREERRRARWNAFWTPFITLTSIVCSVGLLMFLVRACQDRLPYPLQQGAPAPLKNRSTVLGPAEGDRKQTFTLIEFILWL